MDRSLFEQQGFVGPARVMTAAESRAVAAMVDGRLRSPLDWPKGAAPSSRLLYDLAIRPAVLDPVAEVLGHDVVLWGASVVTSLPGHIHLHHVDIETAHPEARTLSVWIGLENTSRDSSLRLVTRSHRIGRPIQQVAHEKGRRRGEYGESEVVAWALERDPEASLVQLDVSDGEAIWFDGHLWHGSHNRTALTRKALLLQYAAASTPIRIPDFSSLEWPFRFFEAPRPPCIVVRGEGDGEVNRLVPAPLPEHAGDPAMTVWAMHLILPLEQNPATGFMPHHLFRGVTGNTTVLNCHVSILDPGVSPHEPHRHAEEELLIVLDGAAEVEFDDGIGRRVCRVTPGALSYYPAGRAHTIRGAGEGSVQYLMLKWTGPSNEVAGRLDAEVHSYGHLEPVGDGGFRTARLLEGPTASLRKLHCHLTELDPGAGYEPHVDAHDVVIVLLEGTVDTVGATVVAPAVVFTSGGVAHGMRNSGASPARYLVFEFHGNAPASVLPEPAQFEAAAVALVESRLQEPERDGIPMVRRVRVALWRAGGRRVRRFPRLHLLLRRLLRGVSPWD